MSPGPATRRRKRRPLLEEEVTLTRPAQRIRRRSAGKPSWKRTAWDSRRRHIPIESKSRRAFGESAQKMGVSRTEQF